MLATIINHQNVDIYTLSTHLVIPLLHGVSLLRVIQVLGVFRVIYNYKSNIHLHGHLASVH